MHDTKLVKGGCEEFSKNNYYVRIDDNLNANIKVSVFAM